MAAVDYRDFYIKYPQHSKYNSEAFFTETKTDMIVNKIEMVLFTNKGDFIGDLSFGCDLEFYLWQTKVSAAKIEESIRSQFSIYISELDIIGYSLNVSIMQGDIRDILIVDIVLNDQTIQAVLR
jgi:hypothetical protein